MFICTHCGWEGERKKRLRGSKTLEVVIWSTLLLPGPLYSFWRRTGKQTVCSHCQLPMLVKSSSDAGWLAKRKFDVELGIVPVTVKKTEPAIHVFGNEKTAETPRRKTPVDPEQW